MKNLITFDTNKSASFLQTNNKGLKPNWRIKTVAGQLLALPTAEETAAKETAAEETVQAIIDDINGFSGEREDFYLSEGPDNDYVTYVVEESGSYNGDIDAVWNLLVAELCDDEATERFLVESGSKYEAIQALLQFAEPVLSTGYQAISGSVFSIEIGEVYEILPDAITERLSALSDDDFDTVRRSVDAFLPDASGDLYLGLHGYFWHFVVDIEQATERLGA